ncbi:hypothetical protein [Natronogracilivirga saccharolytica]|uniref:Uncharacterized protein n=1 Tax=Natronogracilivirga saccharolytica TaxID=2812953 RepID=A0A8J7RQ75_9BACT|nr:hypothetical protein [Natronogracilivirga saccharolytica]MBP3191894.1 hypothetical protein [Natronogracilivirga saccharolytica]
MIRYTAILLFIVPILISKKADAQQMIVDDAAVTTQRSFQIESWYGTEESWFQPAVSVTRWLELTAGMIFDSSDGLEPDNWFIEFKAVPGDVEVDGWAYGLVLAPVFNFDGDLDEFFSYVLFSKMILDGSSVLHLNLGMEGFNEHDREYAFTSGIRGDFGIRDRVMILSEIFTSNFETPSFQTGLRLAVIPDLIEMDVTYGEGFRKGMSYPGFNIGIAITPDRMW